MFDFSLYDIVVVALTLTLVVILILSCTMSCSLFLMRAVSTLRHFFSKKFKKTSIKLSISKIESPVLKLFVEKIQQYREDITCYHNDRTTFFTEETLYLKFPEDLIDSFMNENISCFSVAEGTKKISISSIRFAERIGTFSPVGPHEKRMFPFDKSFKNSSIAKVNLLLEESVGVRMEKCALSELVNDDINSYVCESLFYIFESTHKQIERRKLLKRENSIKECLGTRNV